MSQFKGTKGKWEINCPEGSNGFLYISRPRSCYGEIATCYAVSEFTGEVTEETKANAQLIATATELLDFVNRISGEMLRNDFVLSEEWYEQARDLIKQATTI